MSKLLFVFFGGKCLLMLWDEFCNGITCQSSHPLWICTFSLGSRFWMEWTRISGISAKRPNFFSRKSWQAICLLGQGRRQKYVDLYHHSHDLIHHHILPFDSWLLVVICFFSFMGKRTSQFKDLGALFSSMSMLLANTYCLSLPFTFYWKFFDVNYQHQKIVMMITDSQRQRNWREAICWEILQGARFAKYHPQI